MHTKIKNKKPKMTLEKLGLITQRGFLEMDKKIDGVRLELSKEIGEVKHEVREMKENFSELFVKLDKFIALYEKQEQELLILSA